LGRRNRLPTLLIVGATGIVAAACAATPSRHVDIHSSTPPHATSPTSLGVEAPTSAPPTDPTTGRLGAEVIVALSTNGPITSTDFTDMMNVLSGASRIVFVNIHVDWPWQDPSTPPWPRVPPATPGR
jgi:hypothetical protein